MSDSWIISAAGRIYGPYGREQLRALAAEGRLARRSMVAREGETEFRRAIDEPELADLFGPRKSTEKSSEEMDAMRGPRRESPTGFGRNDESSRSERPSHFVVIADLKSGSIAKLEETIATLGHGFPILPQVWLLSSQATVSTIRNALTPQLGKLDMLFIVDAGNDKAAWFNFGPEADSRIRKLWQSDQKLRAAG